MQLLAQDKIPAGTILPVQLNSSLRSDKARVGEQISARVMQDVPLPGGRKIHAGAKVIGHVVSTRPAANGMKRKSRLRFDTFEIGKRTFTHDNELEGAGDHDGCIRSSDSGERAGSRNLRKQWTTDQIGGEVVYRGGFVALFTLKYRWYSVPAVACWFTSVPRPGMKCRGEVDEQRPTASAMGVLFRCLWPLRFAELDSCARRSERSGWSDQVVIGQGQRKSSSGQRNALACNRDCAMRLLSSATELLVVFDCVEAL